MPSCLQGHCEQADIGVCLSLRSWGFMTAAVELWQWRETCGAGDSIFGFISSHGSFVTKKKVDELLETSGWLVLGEVCMS